MEMDWVVKYCPFWRTRWEIMGSGHKINNSAYNNLMISPVINGALFADHVP